jgi:hypothetical protein
MSGDILENGSSGSIEVYDNEEKKKDLDLDDNLIKEFVEEKGVFGMDGM